MQGILTRKVQELHHLPSFSHQLSLRLPSQQSNIGYFPASKSGDVLSDKGRARSGIINGWEAVIEQIITPHYHHHQQHDCRGSYQPHYPCHEDNFNGHVLALAQGWQGKGASCIQIEEREGWLGWLYNQTLQHSASQRTEGNLFDTPHQNLCTQEVHGGTSSGQIPSKGVLKPWMAMGPGVKRPVGQSLKARWRHD